MEDTKTRGTALVLIAAVLWSTNGVAIKYIDASPALIACFRALFAGLVMLPFLKPRELRPSLPLLGLLVSYSFMCLTFVTATKWTAAANAIALQYTAPLWIFAASLLARKIGISTSRVVPMAMVAGGIALFLLEPARGPGMAGNLLGVASGIGFALVTVLLRALRERHNLTLICAANFAAFFALLPLAGGYDDAAALGGADWLCLGYLGVFQMGGGYLFYTLGLKRVDSLRAATLALLEPVLNPLWVVLFIGEVPTIHGAAGAAAILIGIVTDVRLNRPEVTELPEKAVSD